ncbi:hypothetical protein TSACC_3686 [Terrimicrobium sacchariphilum]|uniref:Capsid protein n=1 Tax=Terrimicrobium sacchariphilum TaxID=690879 RepID=A0A146GDJ0_TERSA|nr:phage capsid protein [Terrimicrobium sacchariphilum]GAT35615.1 hypothetical protein TSACC_3686 [Terrimicrobium sacchariphilum]
MSNALRSIPEHYVTAYATNWEHLSSQMISRLKGQVAFDTVEGKEKSYSKIGGVQFQRITERAGATRIQDITTSKRWLRPYPFDAAHYEDEWDEKFLGDVSKPDSDVLVEHSAAYGRLADQIILEAAVGTAYTGEIGMTPITLPASQTIAVDFVRTGSAANSGLTLDKLRRAKRILDDNEVPDDEQRTIAVTSAQIEDLLRYTEVTSKDYNIVQALVDGTLNKFLGFEFKRVSSDIVPKSGNIRSVVFWSRRGIKLSDSGKQSHMDILPTQSHCLQIRSVGLLGATRDEEKKVGVIYCDESV